MTQQICCYFSYRSVWICVCVHHGPISLQLPWLVTMETQSSPIPYSADKHWESPQPPPHFREVAWTSAVPSKQGMVGIKKVDICSRALKAQARPPSPSSAGLWPRPGHLPKVSALCPSGIKGDREVHKCSGWCGRGAGDQWW